MQKGGSHSAGRVRLGTVHCCCSRYSSNLGVRAKSELLVICISIRMQL